MKTPPPKRVHSRDSDPVEQESSVGWDMDVVLVPFKVHWRRHTNAEVERIEYGRRVSMETAKKADQKKFLKAVLNFDWLPAKVRYAVADALGRSLQNEKKEINQAKAETLRAAIEESAAEKKKRGERPRGEFARLLLMRSPTSWD